MSWVNRSTELKLNSVSVWLWIQTQCREKTLEQTSLLLSMHPWKGVDNTGRRKKEKPVLERCGVVTFPSGHPSAIHVRGRAERGVKRKPRRMPESRCRTDLSSPSSAHRTSRIFKKVNGVWLCFCRISPPTKLTGTKTSRRSSWKR